MTDLSRPEWAAVTGLVSAVGTGVRLKQRYANERILHAPWRVRGLFVATCAIQGTLSAGASLPLNELPLPAGSGSLVGVVSTATFTVKPAQEEGASRPAESSPALRVASMVADSIYWISGRLVYEIDKEFAKLKWERVNSLREQIRAALRAAGVRGPAFENVHSLLAQYLESSPVAETKEVMQGQLAAALESTRETQENQRQFTPLLILVINWGLEGYIPYILGQLEPEKPSVKVKIRSIVKRRR